MALNRLPTSLEPIGTFSDGQVPVIANKDWYLFWNSLSSVLGNLINGVLGFTSESGVTATGTVQGDAFVMVTEWVEVSITPVNSGVLLQGFGAGVASTVFNEGLNTLKVYPPVGARIDALAINAPYSLPTTKMQTFYQTQAAQWRSTQLG